MAHSGRNIEAFSIGGGKDKASITEKLVPGRTDKALCFCIPMSWIILPEDGEAVAVNNSAVSTVFLLLNTMIGSGILVQAYAFSRSGLVLAIFEYIIIGTLNYMGVDILIRCAVASNIFDFPQLASSFLGPWGATAVDASVVMMNAGALLSYILIIGTLIEDIVGDCSDWYCNVGFLTVLPVVGCAIPLCLIRNFGHLVMVSYFSVIIVAATIMLVIVGGPVTRARADDDVSYVLGSFSGCVRTIGDIVFALGYITATFHAYNAMENKSVKNFASVSLSTTVIGVLMCFFTGLIGFLSFGEDTQTNILQNFHGPVGAVFKVALIVHLLLYIPGDFVILRHSLLNMFNIDVATQPNSTFVGTTLGAMLLVTFIAIMLQLFLASTNSLAIVVDITGGIAGSMLFFVLPGLCGMKQFRPLTNGSSSSEAQTQAQAQIKVGSLSGSLSESLTESPDAESIFYSRAFLYYKSVVLLFFGAAVIILVILSSALYDA